MQHYFVKNIINNKVYFEDEDIHHILHVMRLRTNDVVICNFDHKSYEVSLEVSQKDVIGNVIKELDKKDNTLNVTIIHGMPKNDKFELALQKATELGVGCYVAYLSDRSVVKIDSKDAPKKLERWNKIAKEASEQSERISMPKIMGPISKKEVINFKSDINLICDENFGRNSGLSLNKILPEIKDKSVTLIVGPEGGFSKEEFDYFHSVGFISVGLGKRILRSETAVMYALSAMSLIKEEE